MTSIFLFLTSFVLSAFTFSDAQEKERFAGQSMLADCLEEIPMSYSTKKKGPFLEAVNKLDSVELVLVTVKKNENTYKFYYFKKTKSIDGETAYLTSPEEFLNDLPYDSAFFLNYKRKKHFFYRADCFREKMEEHDELRKVLKKGSQ